MKKEDTDRKEFYESNWLRILPLLVFMMFLVTPFTVMCTDIIFLIFLILILGSIFVIAILYVSIEGKFPHVVVNSKGITYKDKLFGMDYQNVSIVWENIKKITLTYSYIRKLPVKEPSPKIVLKLVLKNGQEKRIFLNSISDKTRRLILDTIKHYKKVSYEEIEYESNEIFWDSFFAVLFLLVCGFIILIKFYKLINS